MPQHRAQTGDRAARCKTEGGTGTQGATTSTEEEGEKEKGMIEIFQSKKNKQFYFRVKARNNRIIAQSEGYMDRRGAERGIKALVKAGKDHEQDHAAK